MKQIYRFSLIFLCLLLTSRVSFGQSVVVHYDDFSVMGKKIYNDGCTTPQGWSATYAERYDDFLTLFGVLKSPVFSNGCDSLSFKYGKDDWYNNGYPSLCIEIQQVKDGVFSTVWSDTLNDPDAKEGEFNEITYDRLKIQDSVQLVITRLSPNNIVGTPPNGDVTNFKEFCMADYIRDTILPTIPTNLVGQPDYTSISLSWNAATDNNGVEGYHIYLDGNLVDKVTDTICVVTGLNPQTAYTLEVAAYDDDQNVSTKASVVCTTLTDSEAPTNPTNLTGVSKDCGMILSWLASTDNVGVVKYNVYVGGTLRASTADLTDTITGLSDDTEYLFEVEAEDVSGNVSGKISATISTTIDRTAPTVPTDLQATAEDNMMILTWTASTDVFGVAKYNIYLDGEWLQSTTTVKDTLRNLAANTQYTIEIEAEDATGNISEKASVTSSTSVDNEAPTAPENLVATAGDGGVLLSWDASTDNFEVAKYIIIYAQGDSVLSTTQLSATIVGLFTDEDNEITVEAEDASGNKSVRTSISISQDSMAPFSFSNLNNLTISRTRDVSDFRVSKRFTQLFNYPEDYNTKTKIAEADDISISYSSTNEDHLLFDGYYYSSYSGQYLYYNIPGGAYGNDTLTISINYNGYNAKALIIANVVPINAKDDTYTIDIGDTLTMNVASNDATSAYLDKTTIETLQDVKYGKMTNNNDGTFTYINNSETENYSYENFEYRIADTVGHYDTALVTINIHKYAYATRVIDFLPAPGQFTNESIGQSTSAEKTLGTQDGMISLGAFGGYVIYGFDQTIVNNPKNPYGVDFSIKGNSFVANLYGAWTEPAAVRVMKDKNGDGIPNDGEWYELAGSDYYMSSTEKNVKMTYYNPHYNERYTVPWEKSTGETGALLSNAFHSHSYYPDPFDFGCNRDSLTYEGSIIKSSLDMSTPSYIEFYRAPFFGYCDNRGNSSDLTDPQNPYYKDEKGNAADGFDLSWAVDSDGNHIDLDSVDFVKVYTGGFANAGWLGEWSSEVRGVGITTPDPDYVEQDYYINYIGITQLKVLKGHTCQFEGFLFKNGVPQTEGAQKWSTSNDAVATVDNTGLFTAVGGGETWLRFSQKDDIATDSIRVQVVELTGVMLEMEGNSSASADSTSLIVGEAISITAQATDNISDVVNGSTSNRFTYENYTWTTTNPEIGTVDNGLFVGKKVGRTLVYAHSNTSPELYDSILVVVEAVPSLDIVSNPINVVYNDPVGEKTVDELFTTETNATVYLDGVVSKTGLANPTIEDNALYCNFTEGVYGIDTFSFNVAWYKKDTTINIIAIYKPDAYATDEQVVFVNNAMKGNTNKSSLLTYRSDLDSTIVIDDQLVANSVKDVLVDGAFAFVSGDSYLSKYNLTNYNTDTTTTVENSGNGGLAVYGNLLLVAEQSDLVMYYKTDLAFCKKIPFEGIINDVEVVGDKAFVLLDDEVTNELTTIATVEFVKGEIERVDTISATDFVVSSAMANDTAIFVVGTSAGKSAVLEYCIDAATDSVIVSSNILNSTFNTNAVIKEDTMFIPCGAGFVVYNITSGTFGTDTLMTATDGLFPTSIAYHDSLDYYFVSYSNEAETSSKGLVFNADFAQIEDVDSVGIAPKLLTSVNTIENNSNPQIVASYTLSNYTTYEQYTRNTNIYIYNNRFVDEDGDFEVYTRYLEHASWLTWNSTYSSTAKKRYYAKYTGTVDADSVITIPVEAIDKWGFCATRTFNITIKARVVKPVVENPIQDTVVVMNSDIVQIPLSDVFLETSTSGVSFGRALSNNTDTALISTSIVNDTLTIAVAPDTIGYAYITIKDSAKHNSYGVKYAETTFKVTVKDTVCPTVPANLTGIPAEDSISYTWDASDDNYGVENYRLYWDGVVIDTVVDTIYTVSGLNPATEYTFSVVACDEFANCSEEASITLSTIDETAPSTPTDLLATATDTTMSLSWAASTDNVATEGYIVYLDNDSINDVVDTFCTIVNLQSATEYKLGVKAYDASGNCSQMAEITQETTLIFEIEGNGLKVYPNPCSDGFTLETESDEDLLIYDLTGRVKLKMICHKGANKVNVSALSTGIYYLQQGTSTLKMIKK